VLELNNAYILLLALLAILLVSVGYGLWSSSLRANVYVYIVPSRLEIGSWKVFATYQDSSCRGFNATHLSPKNDTLYIDIGNTVVNSMWIGLVVENNGEIGVDLAEINISLNDSLGSYNITPHYYLYDPIKTGVGNMPYWGGISCSDLPVSGYSSTLPIHIPAGYKMVAWIHIDLGLSNTEIAVKIASRIS
jgi:hypothetical protein